MVSFHRALLSSLFLFAIGCGHMIPAALLPGIGKLLQEGISSYKKDRFSSEQKQIAIISVYE